MSPGDRVDRVRALVAAEEPSGGDHPAAVGWLQRMCRVAARELPADGVGISLMSTDGNVLTAAASSPRSLLLEELQFTVGEGPCLSAYASRRPVLVPDLDAFEDTWPGYVPAAREYAVRAVFAFPLQAGSVRVGALDVYRDRIGALPASSLAHAATFAQTALDGLLSATDHSSGGEDLLLDVSETRYEVYQAQGMVMAQLEVEAEAAMLRLRAHAFVAGLSLAEVAQGVLGGNIVLESDDLW